MLGECDTASRWSSRPPRWHAFTESCLSSSIRTCQSRIRVTPKRRWVYCCLVQVYAQSCSWTSELVPKPGYLYPASRPDSASGPTPGELNETIKRAPEEPILPLHAIRPSTIAL
ncbi:hypothetical protein TcWFU_001727 [Taenia crassiceps]|uniref:Uncharacterized protein n=1 Tax=Taenia crassiceps TaxID=6207 RepID=A0ABR4QP80_9CEST